MKYDNESTVTPRASAFLSYFSLQRSTFSALALFLLLALAWTWPLAARFSWRTQHDPGDPTLNAWILWWNAQAVPFTDAWWNAPIFHPMSGAFALSEHLAGLAVFTTPLQLAGLNPLPAYNVALVLSFWLSGYFAFLLGRRLTGSTGAGLIAGAAFGFAPYRASQLSHLQVLSSQWMPLALLAMHGYLDSGRRWYLLLFAVAWLLQALSSGYYLLFFPVLVAQWLLWFGSTPSLRLRGLTLAGTFAAAALLLVPGLLRYKEIHDAFGLVRPLEEMRHFSARLDSFILPADLLKFWGSWSAETQEAFLFPGMTVIALTLAGAAALVWRGALRQALSRRSAAMFYGLAALVSWWLCLGPSETASSWGAIERPYTLLTWLPGFEGLRVPARFAMLATLCISLAAAIAAARLAPARGPTKRAAGLVVAAGLFVDGWVEPLPVIPPPQQVMVRAPAAALMIELPSGNSSVNVDAMYRSMTHQLPLVNGYSGHVPEHYSVIATALGRGDPSILTHFARGRSLVVVVHRQHDPGGDFRALVKQAGGLLLEESGVGPAFMILPQPALHRPPVGPALTAIPSTSPAGYAAIDLGSDRIVRAVSIPVGKRFGDMAPRMTVETSSDGTTWTTAWDDWTGEPALTAAQDDPRVVLMKLPLPDVLARYLRVTPIPAWAARELKAHGPGR